MPELLPFVAVGSFFSCVGNGRSRQLILIRCNFFYLRIRRRGGIIVCPITPRSNPVECFSLIGRWNLN
jgi:hypothetical protein